MKISKEVKIGAVMVLAIFLAVWGANYLKGTNFFDNSRHFYAVYENINGLSRTNPVKINGFKVGQVEEIDFLPDFSGKLYVKFSVTKDEFRIPKGTRAEIFSDGFLGAKAIRLKLTEEDVFHNDRDTLFSGVEASLQESVNAQIAPLKRKAESLIGSIDSAITTVKSIFNTKAQEDIGSSISNIRQSLEIFKQTMLDADAMVNENRVSFKNISSGIESIVTNFEKNNETLNKTLANLQSISDSLAGANLQQTINNASLAMQEIAELMGKVNRGEGSIGALLNNDSLYKNLEAAAYDLDQLMLDMRLNPERYVHFSIFGRKSKKKSPAETP
ncbi:MAG: MCE family protein [Flavobacteriales bacterium]|nr:MCE family protein [Flavobacteriales bacterium]